MIYWLINCYIQRHLTALSQLALLIQPSL